MAAEQAKALIDSMPVAYAVTYMFGTMGSAVVIAVLGPKLLGINLEAACKDYEQKQGGAARNWAAPARRWRRWEVRAFRVAPGGKAVGLRVIEAEALVPDARIFVLRIRRNGKIEEAARGHRAPGRRRRGGRGRPRRAREAARGTGHRGRGSGAAGGAGRGRRRPRQQQGGRRHDAGRTGAAAGDARRVPAEDHARRHRDQHPDPADHHGSTRRPADDRRPHAGHQHRRSSCWVSPIARPTSPTWRSSARSS